MLIKLNKELKKLGVQIIKNTIDKELSGYLMIYKNKIIGIGWKAQNKELDNGFMGYYMPNQDTVQPEFTSMIASKIVNGLIVKKIIVKDFLELLNLFQFGISEDYFWFSPPVNVLLEGLKCPPLKDVKIISSYIESFLNKENLKETVSRFEKEVLNIGI